MNHPAIIIAIIAATITGDYALKLASEKDQFLSTHLLIGIIFYALPAFGWMHLMKTQSLATIGIIYSSVTIIILFLMSIFVFRETVPLATLLQVLLLYAPSSCTEVNTLMLLIPYYIASSAIHGMGVFAAVSLRSNDIVWRYDPTRDIIITLEDFKILSPKRKNDVVNHAQWYPEKEHFVLGCDGDYFMNHAENATLKDRGDTMVAAQDLPIGTELTCDYRVVKVLGFQL